MTVSCRALRTHVCDCRPTACDPSGTNSVSATAKSAPNVVITVRRSARGGVACAWPRWNAAS